MRIGVHQLSTEELRVRDRFFQPVFREIRASQSGLGQPEVDVRAYRNRQMAYAHSEAAKLYAALRVLPNEPLSAVRKLAASVHPGGRNSEPVPWSWLRKADGRGRRPVCRLPPVLKANHYIIKDLLFSQGRPAPHLYDGRGKGTTAAALRVIQALEEGYDWCWTGDVRDCFQRVSASSLRRLLPLPSSLIRTCLDHRELNISCGLKAANGHLNGSHVADGARRHGPRGLLHGSPASNAVLSALLADIADAVSPLDCVICVFADNFFLAAQTEDLILQAVALVRDYLLAHPGGPFRLHKEVVVAPRQPFDYLGYQFNRSNGGVTLEPTFTGYERMYGAFADAEERDMARADGLITEVEGKLRSYSSAYPLWAGASSTAECVRHQSTDLVRHWSLMTANKGLGTLDTTDYADHHDLACRAP